MPCPRSHGQAEAELALGLGSLTKALHSAQQLQFICTPKTVLVRGQPH